MAVEKHFKVAVSLLPKVFFSATTGNIKCNVHRTTFYYQSMSICRSTLLFVLSRAPYETQHAIH